MLRTLILIWFVQITIAVALVRPVKRDANYQAQEAEEL